MAPTDTIRRAVPADAVACAQIVHGWLTQTTWIEDPPTLAQLRTGLRGGIPLHEVWALGDPVQAYLSYGPTEKLVRGFYTAHPGTGTGKSLLDHIKRRTDHLQLWTHAPNIRAHAFYEREGFVFSGQTRPGDDGPDEHHMIWHRSAD